MRTDAFTGFCSGPDTIAGLLWVPAIFQLARADQTCGASPDGTSSGADGQQCMTTFNSTLFLQGGGAACFVASALNEADRFAPDDNLPGCTAAYDAYREATTPTFTCNCEGNHASFGGLRSGAVFTISNIIATIIIAIVGPAMGTWIDHNGGKKLWIFTLCVAGLCMFGQAILAPGFVWMGGLIIQIVTIIASELVTIPRQSYLLDLTSPNADVSDSAFQSQVAAKRTAWSYGSQVFHPRRGAQTLEIELRDVELRSASCTLLSLLLAPCARRLIQPSAVTAMTTLLDPLVDASCVPPTSRSSSSSSHSYSRSSRRRSCLV